MYSLKTQMDEGLLLSSTLSCAVLCYLMLFCNVSLSSNTVLKGSIR